MVRLAVACIVLLSCGKSSGVGDDERVTEAPPPLPFEEVGSDGGSDGEDAGTEPHDGGVVADAGIGPPDGGMGRPACSGPGTKIDAPLDRWSYVPFPGTVCGYSGSAGLGINPTRRSRNVLLFLMGGGGCFTQSMCQQGRAANLYGYGPQQLSQELGFFGQGSIFDRASAANPFRDYSYVLVPYCTGDFHWGRAVAPYGVRHKGFENMKAYLARLAPTFCDAERVVLAGASAGGFGAAVNFEQVQAAFGSIPVDLVIDSGPLMRPPYMSAQFQAQVHQAWGSKASFPPGCQGCDSEWHRLYPYLAARYPGRRMSLLSSLWDFSIGSNFFFQLDRTSMERGLNDLADNVLSPLPNVRVFYIASQDHVWLGRNLAGVQTRGVSLSTFLSQQLSTTQSWSNVRP